MKAKIIVLVAVLVAMYLGAGFYLTPKMILSDKKVAETKLTLEKSNLPKICFQSEDEKGFFYACGEQTKISLQKLREAIHECVSNKMGIFVVREKIEISRKTFRPASLEISLWATDLFWPLRL